MHTATQSSHSYDFSQDFRALARPGRDRYLRECGYEPNEPRDGMDDCWATGRYYVRGLWRYLKADQGSAELGEPWGVAEAKKSAGAYEVDMIIARKQSGLEELEFDSYIPLSLPNKAAEAEAWEWYNQIPSVKRSNERQLERERQFDRAAGVATDAPEAKPKPDVKSVESMFQRVGLLASQPREYLVKGFIPRNEVCNPFGRPDSFKGVSATQLTVHIAGGVDFLGMEVKQGPSAYFAGERGEQAKRRIKGHMRRLGLPDSLPCYFGGKPINLLSKPDLDFLIANIRAIESDAGAPLGFLVVDTQSRSMDGDENSTRDGAAYAKAIEAIREATEATLWIIAHTGHSEDAQDRPRGSSALLGAYDTFYRHKKIDERSGEIKITIDRDGLGGKEIPFTVELYDTGAVNEDGEPVMIPYLEAAAAPVRFTFKKGEEPSKSESPTRAESEALRALHKAIKKHGEVTPKGEGVPAGETTVCEREWRDSYYELFRMREQTTLRQGFSRSTKSLIAKKFVNEYGSRRWPAE
jgi:hypothetical protein